MYRNDMRGKERHPVRGLPVFQLSARHFLIYPILRKEGI
jgi:hypothetical protein